MRPSVGARVLIAAAVGFNALYVASLFVVERPETGYLSFWDGWVYWPASALPLVLLLWRAVVDRTDRLAWLLIGGGVLATGIADLIYQVHDVHLEEFGFPTASDVFYLLAYPLWAAGIVVMAFTHSRRVSRAATLDGFVVGLSVAALAVIRWFAAIYEQSGSAADVTAGISFAVLDVVLIVVAVAALALQRFRPAPALLVIAVAAGAFGLGDLIYLNRLTDAGYVGGTWIDGLWSVGTLLFGLAAWLPTDRRGGPIAPDATEAHTLGPVAGVAAVGSLAIVVAGLVGGVPHTIPGLAAAMAVVALALVLLRVLWTVRELAAVNESYRQARTDDLTGLGNRRAFMEDVDRMLDAAPSSLSVVMVDLNGFKEVNDSLGHPAGDRLLTIVGERLRVAVPPGLALARLGGDEFGLVAPTPLEGGVDVAKRMLAALDGPVELEGLSVRVSASIGVAGGSPRAESGAMSRQEVIRMADVAMYDAKRQGIGFSCYSEAIDPHGRERILLIDDLCRAIEDRSFHLHLQPVVSLERDELVAVEALIRWEHPERGPLAPEAFIPLAERSGLVPRITRVVLEQAARHLATLRAAGLDVGISVNISALDLVDEDLPGFIESTFDQAGAPLDRLTLEITETAVASDPGRSLRTLQALRARGVRISIDDFGVGYSSLNQLLQLPVDELKLDRSFIIPIERDRRAQAIVRSTVELGRTLGLTVVAEGVETDLALTFVRSRGVHRAQGFHLAPPMAVDELVAFATDPANPLAGRSGPGR